MSKNSGQATNGLVAHKKPKTVGETLGIKGRNPMESSNIKGGEVAINSRKNMERRVKKKTNN